MSRIILFFGMRFLCFSLVGSSSVFARSLIPKLEDYKVENVYSGPYHSLVNMEGGDSKWLTYRGRAVSGGVNFAGHYVVVSGDCGGGAVCGEIVDILSGEMVAGFPNAYELESPEAGYYDAVFKAWSRLLIISGVAADPEKKQ